MFRHFKIVCSFATSLILIGGFTRAQHATPVQSQAEKPAAGAPGAVKDRNVPLFFSEAWTAVPSPPIEHGGPIGQKNVANQNLELKLYGTAKDTDPARGMEQGIQINGGPGPPGTGHLYTGLCDRPCGMTLRDKSNYVDLSGYGKIRWSTRVSGLHLVHPLLKLADGKWVLGEHGEGTADDYHLNEFTLSGTRWIEMDIDKVVTKGGWLSNVDLGKVDEIGFADLMPGGGHVFGGYVTLDLFEVFGRPVPRSAK